MRVACVADWRLGLILCNVVNVQRNVRRRAEDPGALDVEDGVPPPRAAPPLLRRVVLSRSDLGVIRFRECHSLLAAGGATALTVRRRIPFSRKARGVPRSLLRWRVH